MDRRSTAARARARGGVRALAMVAVTVSVVTGAWMSPGSEDRDLGALERHDASGSGGSGPGGAVPNSSDVRGAWVPAPWLAEAVHQDDHDVIQEISIKQVAEVFSPNLNRPDFFTYGRTIFTLGPFSLVDSRRTHYSVLFDSIIPITLPTLRGAGPAYITRLSAKVLKSVDFDTGNRVSYEEGKSPVRLKNFQISKVFLPDPFCIDSRIPIVDVAEYDTGAVELPLPYGIGFGGNRPSAEQFPHAWDVHVRLEDVRTNIGLYYPDGEEKVVVEYQVLWAEDNQLLDAHVTQSNALGCPEEDKRNSVEIGPAHIQLDTDRYH